MKKIILISAAYLAMASVNAQNKQLDTPPPPPAPPVASMPVPPPPPPAPPVLNHPIPPPPPTAPPLPPVPPIISQHFGDDVTEMTVRNINGNSTVIVKKDGKIHRIKMATWDKNKKYYEKKYGKLPPPPPPLINEDERIEVTPPIIQKSN